MTKDKYKAVCVKFDIVTMVCPFFTGKTEVNNGYGCNHKNQEEGEEVDGKFCGACFARTCPLSSPVSQEDLTDENIDWTWTAPADLNVESGSDVEYVLIPTGTDATEEEVALQKSCEKYLLRYSAC